MMLLLAQYDKKQNNLVYNHAPGGFRNKNAALEDSKTKSTFDRVNFVTVQCPIS